MIRCLIFGLHDWRDGRGNKIRANWFIGWVRCERCGKVLDG